MFTIAPNYFNSVVPFQCNDEENGRGRLGTGFLIGKPIKYEPDGTRKFLLFIVTCEHVLHSMTSVESQLTGLFAGKVPVQFELKNGDGTNRWITPSDESADVAVLPVDGNTFEKSGAMCNFLKPEDMLEISQMRSHLLGEGTTVYILGYPGSFNEFNLERPIVRTGAVAVYPRVNDNMDFLVDAFVFPGNSGGPVLARIENGNGTPYVGYDTRLIGIVSSHFLEEKTAIDPDTGLASVAFPMHSGLTVVYPVDTILEAVDLASDSMSPAEKEACSIMELCGTKIKPDSVGYDNRERNKRKSRGARKSLLGKTILKNSSARLSY